MRRSFSRRRALNKQAANAHLYSSLPPHSIPTDPARVHAQALLCARLSGVLHYALLGLDWPQVRFSDRTRLKRSLTLLAGDIPLVWLIAGQPLEDAQQQVDDAQRQVTLNHDKEE